MSELTLELNVAKPKAKEDGGEAESRRFGTLVRVADDVAQMARELAPMKRTSMAELMSDVLRPVLQKMLDDEMRRRLGRK